MSNSYNLVTHAVKEIGPLPIEEQIQVLRKVQDTLNRYIKRNRQVYHLCDITRDVLIVSYTNIHITGPQICNYIPLFTFEYATELAKKYKFKKPCLTIFTGWWEDHSVFDIKNRKRFLSCLIKELEKQLNK